MAKKKTKVLWLSKDRVGYELFPKEPKWRIDKNWWGCGEELYEFCGERFESL